MRRVQFLPKAIFDLIFKDGHLDPDDRIVRAELVEPELKTCVTCKWCAFLEHSHYCHHPKIMKPGAIDPVTGDVVGEKPKICSVMREIPVSKFQGENPTCGPDGAFWEEREEDTACGTG